MRWFGKSQYVLCLYDDIEEKIIYKNGVIYAFVHPVYRVPFYIGKSFRFKERLQSHCLTMNDSTFRPRKKKQEIMDECGYILVKIIEVIPYQIDNFTDVLEQKEYRWIKAFARKYDLCNSVFNR